MNQLVCISEFSGEQGWALRQISYRDISFTNESINIDKSPNDDRNDDKLESTNTIKCRKFVTAMQYYAYQLPIRLNSPNMLLQMERLFQQYVELYKSLQGFVLRGNSDPRQVSQRIVLPSTFIGGSRDMIQRYQDAIALLHFGKPDLFITITYNPNWHEIQALMLPEQKPQDRPDITARLLREAVLVIWDEALMSNRKAPESPVIPKALGCPANNEARTFAKYLLRIGNGTEPTIENDLIQLLDEMIICLQNNKDSIDSLINTVYSNLTKNASNTIFITERAILTSLNSNVDEINKKIMAKYPGEQHIYYSFDSVPEDNLNMHPIKYLNSLIPQGLPPHELTLK
ncbi:137_t:CDS:2, partial [Racocetra persica]